MNTMRPLCFSVFFSAPLIASPFRNLDFESTRLKFPVVTQPTVAAAIPGWGLTIGDQPVSVMAYNTTCLTCPDAALYDANLPGGGKFTFGMTAGTVVDSSPPLVLSASLFQAGDVPGDARSLLFDGNMLGGSLTVSVGGSLAAVIDLGLKPNFFHGYGVDVMGWSGKATELRFTIHPSGGLFPYGNVQLDNIRFSSDALVTVPEPSTWALLGVGGAFLLMVARSRKA